MLEHIVKNGESIEDILSCYHVNINEIKKSNTHITDFRNLVGGTKLRVPMIHAEVEQVLESTESFVADYYSKISEELIPELEERITKVEPIIQDVKENKSETLVRSDSSEERRVAYPGIMPPKRPYNGR